MKTFVVAILTMASLSIAQAADLHKGGTPSEVAAIKKIVLAENHGAITDWFIAIDGNNAVASWAQGPGWGETDGAVKTHGKWSITCRDNAKRGMVGSCGMPMSTYKRLLYEANHLMASQ